MNPEVPNPSVSASSGLSLAERVRIEQQTMLYRQGFFSTSTGLPFAALMAWVLAHQVGPAG